MGTWIERSTGLLPAINNWWEISSVDPADIVAVYQPIGADTLAKSYTNLVNPGINDASPVIAPTWSDTVGWTFTGTEHLTTGIVGNGLHTFMVRINNIAQTAVQRIVMGYNSGRSEFLGVEFAGTINLPSKYNTGFFGGATGSLGDSVACIARNKIYMNSSLHDFLPESALEEWSEGAISIANGIGVASQYIGDISAMAIYNRELTQSEISEISGNMSLLTFADDPDPPLPTVNYIVQNPSTRRLNSLSHELWCATSNGIFRTFDGGRGWAKIPVPNPSNSEFNDNPASTVDQLTFHWIDYDPTDNTILYALAARAATSRVWMYKATNSGINSSDWTSRGVVVA